MDAIEQRIKSEMTEWADGYLRFVRKTMTRAELDVLMNAEESLLKTLLSIVPARVMDTYYVYPVDDTRFLVPKNVTLTDVNKDTLARLASDPKKYGIANPVYVLQEIAQPNRIVIDEVGPI